MTRLLFYLTIALSLSSCSGLKKVHDTTTFNNLLKSESEKVTIRFPGDYWFHDLKRATTLNWNGKFIKSFTSFKPKLMYAAHTVVEPYCTTVGLVYGSKLPPDEFADLVIMDMRKGNKISNLKINEATIKKHKGVNVFYTLYNSTLKVSTKHKEYFLQSQDKMIRLVFWTIHPNESWLESESKLILNSIMLDIN